MTTEHERLQSNGTHHTIAYQPAESTRALLGGNSNWHSPI